MKAFLILLPLAALALTGCRLATATAHGGALAVAPAPSPQPTQVEPAAVTITIVYDNYVDDPSLKAAWGFSCLIDYGGHLLLFDTGGDSDALLSNMALLGLDPERIEAVVLSHIHSDHTGGLAGLLNRARGVTVYVPRSFPVGFKEQVRDADAQLVEVDGPRAIIPGVWSTGEVGEDIREQALVLESAEGLVVITGCAHPGIVRMVEQAKRIGEDVAVHLVLGGFHLGSQSAGQIEGIVSAFRRLGVEKVAPSHCSGDTARALFAAEYGEDCILSGVGWSIALQ
ncbi:MAG: MBL fold metallo-hydrolase [Anaerolineae bacterium]|nr:MBL fold metallo-hydrolase [Anaerolineae bacterium]